jgi:hypothetical protein
MKWGEKPVSSLCFLHKCILYRYTEEDIALRSAVGPTLLAIFSKQPVILRRRKATRPPPKTTAGATTQRPKDSEWRAALLKRVVVGLCKFNPVYTYLESAWFQLLSLSSKRTGFKVCFPKQLVPLHRGGDHGHHREGPVLHHGGAVKVEMQLTHSA